MNTIEWNGYAISDPVPFYDVVAWLKENTGARLITLSSWMTSHQFFNEFPIPIGDPIWTGTKVSCSIQAAWFFKEQRFERWDKTFQARMIAKL